MLKLTWSELNQRMTEFAVALEGPAGQLVKGSAHAVQSGRWQHHFLRSRASTIEAGTSEIERIISPSACWGCRAAASASARAPGVRQAGASRAGQFRASVYSRAHAARVRADGGKTNALARGSGGRDNPSPGGRIAQPG